MLRDLKEALDEVEKQANLRNLSMKEISKRVLWYYEKYEAINAARDMLNQQREQTINQQETFKPHKVKCIECGKKFKTLIPHPTDKNGLTQQASKDEGWIDKIKSLLRKR
jgi:predicted transcriptional regulator